jgi:CRP-like cAMP-binding protein
MPTALETLERAPLFASLDKKARKQVAADMVERRFAAGEEMSTEQHGGVGFFLIAEGTAVVSVGGSERGRLGPGMHYGEMALLTGGTRGATITAESDVQCWVLSAWHFKPLVLEHPQVAWTLMQELAERVRSYQASIT